MEDIPVKNLTSPLSAPIAASVVPNSTQVKTDISSGSNALNSVDVISPVYFLF